MLGISTDWAGSSLTAALGRFMVACTLPRSLAIL
jgi:hypothetical protein